MGESWLPRSLRADHFIDGVGLCHHLEETYRVPHERFTSMALYSLTHRSPACVCPGDRVLLPPDTTLGRGGRNRRFQGRMAEGIPSSVYRSVIPRHVLFRTRHHKLLWNSGPAADRLSHQYAAAHDNDDNPKYHQQPPYHTEPPS